MRHNTIVKQYLRWIALAAIVLVVPGMADAMSWDFDNGLGLDCDVTLGYGAAVRAGEPSDHILADPNIDDGSRNFDRWDFINNRFSIIADIDLRYNNFGAFVRPRAFYDFAYMTSNANDSPGTNNNFIAGTIDSNDEFDSETEDAHGKKAEVLDAFAYANFDIGGGRYLDLRAGRQVVQWGESLFIQGGIASAMAYLDATASNAPGTEVKEILLPSGSVSAQLDVTDSIAVAGFYQYEWEKTRLNESGSFFSDKDYLDEAGNVYLFDHPLYGVIPLMKRGDDKHPDDQGQYGASLIYRAGWLAETEFGFYFINYHEKIPTFNTSVANGIYWLSYGEDVKLYGASFSTLVGSANISGEFSYRQDFPIMTVRGVENSNYCQGQMSWLYSYAAIPGTDRVSFNGEVGFNRVLSLRDEDIDQGKTKFAWGLSMTVTPEWYQVLPNLDMTLPISYKANPKGTSVNTLTFDEQNDSLSVGVQFTYRSNYKISLKYVDFINDSDSSVADRDNIAFDFKYTF